VAERPKLTCGVKIERRLELEAALLALREVIHSP
jgi:hypothetical protein